MFYPSQLVTYKGPEKGGRFVNSAEPQIVRPGHARACLPFQCPKAASRSLTGSVTLLGYPGLMLCVGRQALIGLCMPLPTPGLVFWSERQWAGVTRPECCPCASSTLPPFSAPLFPQEASSLEATVLGLLCRRPLDHEPSLLHQGCQGQGCLSLMHV